MIDRLFGARHSIAVNVTGYIEGRRVRWVGQVQVRGAATVRDVLRAAGRAARFDLLAALERGEQPVILLDGLRLELPDGLTRTVPDGGSLAWLQPMAGG